MKQGWIGKMPLSYFINTQLPDSSPDKLAASTSKMKLTSKEQNNVNNYLNNNNAK